MATLHIICGGESIKIKDWSTGLGMLHSNNCIEPFRKGMHEINGNSILEWVMFLFTIIQAILTNSQMGQHVNRKQIKDFIVLYILVVDPIVSANSKENKMYVQ